MHLPNGITPDLLSPQSNGGKLKRITQREVLRSPISKAEARVSTSRSQMRGSTQLPVALALGCTPNTRCVAPSAPNLHQWLRPGPQHLDQINSASLLSFSRARMLVSQLAVQAQRGALLPSIIKCGCFLIRNLGEKWGPLPKRLSPYWIFWIHKTLEISGAATFSLSLYPWSVWIIVSYSGEEDLQGQQGTGRY